jgi:hypothetical protein
MAYAHAFSRAAKALVDLFQISYSAGRLENIDLPAGFDSYAR